MNGLKEWATVVKALEYGKQTVILRKGGILETASGFRVESKKFLLFPTWEHQETKHVKPEYYDFLNDTLNQKPKQGYNKITSLAEILDEKDIFSKEIVNRLYRFERNLDYYSDNECAHGKYLKDDNNDESDGKDECICPCDYNINGVITDDLLHKWESFGWNTYVMDGHSDHDMSRILSKINFSHETLPKVILAKTIKGYGVPLLEGHGKWHHKVPSESEYKEIIKLLS